MSQTLSRPVPPRRSRRRQALLPPDVLAWRAMSLQKLGWDSKTAQHSATHGELTEAAARIQSTALRGQGGNSASATARLTKGSGKEWKAYHDLQAAFEAAPDRTPDMVERLRKAAQGYVDHYAAHGRKQKDEPKNIEKKLACEATLKELRRFEVVDQVGALGLPPWDGAQAMQAAALKTTLDIASLPKGRQRAEGFGQGHESPAFWINRQTDQGASAKTYIFKPGARSNQPGYPSAGEPAREALTGRLADMLNGALGLSIPAPETQVVTIGRESLPDDAVDSFVNDGAIAPQPTYVGSVQQFAATDGEMRGMSMAELGQVPARQVQELALLDTISLNTDRHAGNMLVKRAANGPPRLVPIDQGLCFPSRGSSSQLSSTIGGSHNALLAMPGSHRPFDAALQQSIAALEPDALAEALKRERATIAEAHPSTMGLISDESIELSRRSAMFLKRAAARLTPAAVQVGIGRFHDELFDPDLDMARFDTLADRIIGEMEADQDDLAEYLLMPRELQLQVSGDLVASNWAVAVSEQSDQVRRNPAMALRVWKAGVRGPSSVGDVNRPMPVVDDAMRAKLGQARQVFPQTAEPQTIYEWRMFDEAWEDWGRLNGSMDDVREAAKQLGARGSGLLLATKDVVTAARLLRKFRAFEHDMGSPGDGDLKMLQALVKFIDGLLPALDAAARTTATNRLAPVRTALAGPAPLPDQDKQQYLTLLQGLRDPLADAARARLLAKCPQLIAAAGDDTDERRVAEKLAFDIQSGALASGYARMKAIDATLADA